jgi:hypothetical protein
MQFAASLFTLTSPETVALRRLVKRMYYDERKSTSEIARLLKEPESLVWSTLARISNPPNVILRVVSDCRAYVSDKPLRSLMRRRRKS